MAFELIRISNLRNIDDCEFAPVPGLNLFKGENGSGKTSLLEGIYILGRGRSFRDTQLVNLVQKGKNTFTVFGKKQAKSEKIFVGLNYSELGSSVRLNGERVSKLSLLAKQTPIHIITPRSHEIIDAGSSVRRRFLEWGVFHVEPQYQYFSSRYQRALSQRNMALRVSPESARFWDKELIESGMRLQEFRSNYFKYLKDEFLLQLDVLQRGLILEITLYQGWSIEKTLGQVLEDGFVGDTKRGFTRMGPHRADLVICKEKKPFDKWGSRGQLKMAIFALFIAQANVIKLLSNKDPILLIDDLTAELDSKNIGKLIDQLEDQGNQTFLTTSDLQLIIPKHLGKMFHVEQGAISELGV